MTDIAGKLRTASTTKPSLVLLVVCVAQFVLQVDFSVVNVALPSIQHDVGFTTAGLQWLVTGFALTFGSLLLFGGRAGDVFGQRRVLVIGLVVFGCGSILCGLAQDPVTLVAARVGQGVGGALVSPSALATLTRTFEDGAARIRALGVWQAVTAAGAMTGVLAGGALVEFVGWRSIFLVNVPIVVALLIAVPRTLPRPSRGTGSLQLTPSVLVTFAIGGLIAGFNQGEQHGFLSTITLLCFGLTIVAGALFWLQQRRRSDKLIAPALLQSRQRRGALIVLILNGAVLTSYVYFASLYLQDLLRMTPLTTGLALLPGTAVNIVLASLLTRRIIAKIGLRATALLGLASLIAGQGWFATVAIYGGYLPVVLPAALITSIGLGMAAPTLTVAATTGITRRLQGEGASLVATAQSIGSAIGLAVLGSLADTVAAEPSHDVADGYSAAFVVAACTIAASLTVIAFTFSDHKHTATAASAAHRIA